jgi:uroporphyrin-III C-methyltransferase/precorrin-2 dehydrogenase/sirohydrochlorin ferrochelatase
MKLIPEGSARRRYFEALVSGAEVEAALRKGLPEGRRAAVKLLDAHAGRKQSAGALWLVGSGPGDADLLTLRAQRRLQEADVIAFDPAVPEVLVQLGRRDAERVVLDPANRSQNKNLLVDLAKRGKRVAWLVCGDGGEAQSALRGLQGAGIPVEIVPGVAGDVARDAARVA